MTVPEDLAKLTAAAEAGDLEAQYSLGAAYHARRDLAQAMAWTERAAKAGHSHAQYTLGAFALTGAIPLSSASAHLATLSQAANKGLPQAQRLLSVVRAWGFLGQPDWPAAVAGLIAAAQSGDPGAMREIAFLQGMATGDMNAGKDMLVWAARHGDPLAAQWAGNATVAPPPPKWNAIESMIASLPPERAGAATPLCPSPKARTIPGLFRNWECAYAVARSSTLVARSQVVDEGSGKGVLHPDRSSSTVAFWPIHDDLVMHRLTLRMAAAADLHWRQGEILNVMRYELGQQYKPHFDFFNESAAGTAETLAQGGQRIRTVLVYLNAGYGGGETCFIPPNVRYKGAAPGDALIFDNVGTDGAPDRASLHAGLPVTQGVKWLASKWFRADNHW
jgi:prolyl 4-hydroxylase